MNNSEVQNDAQEATYGLGDRVRNLRHGEGLVFEIATATNDYHVAWKIGGSSWLEGDRMDLVARAHYAAPEVTTLLALTPLQLYLLKAAHSIASCEDLGFCEEAEKAGLPALFPEGLKRPDKIALQQHSVRPLAL